MVSLQGSDAGDRDERGFEVLAADAVIPETLRVKLLAGMLQAKLYSFAPYDGSLISQRNPHKSVSQGDPEFIVAVWEAQKYIKYMVTPKN
jgi:hypothetical protein